MLTERRRRFIDHYLRTGNGAESARLAGFAEPARQSAYQILANTDVRDAIAERAADIAVANELTPEWVVSRLMRLSERDDLPPVQLQALRELGRVLSLFTDRVSVDDVRARSRAAAIDAGLDPDEVEREALRLLAPND